MRKVWNTPCLMGTLISISKPLIVVCNAANLNSLNATDNMPRQCHLGQIGRRPSAVMQKACSWGAVEGQLRAVNATVGIPKAGLKLLHQIQKSISHLHTITLHQRGCGKIKLAAGAPQKDCQTQCHKFCARKCCRFSTFQGHAQCIIKASDLHSCKWQTSRQLFCFGMLYSQGAMRLPIISHAESRNDNTGHSI